MTIRNSAPPAVHMLKSSATIRIAICNPVSAIRDLLMSRTQQRPIEISAGRTTHAHHGIPVAQSS